MFKKITDAVKVYMEESETQYYKRKENKAWQYCKNEQEKRIEESKKTLRR